MARKGRVKKTKEVKQPTAKACDFVFPGENRSYWVGVGVVAFLFVWLAVLGYFLVKGPDLKPKPWIPLEILAYPVLAFLIGNILAARPRQAQLKKAGRQARVTSNNYADLYRVLSRQASLLGMKATPEMYIVTEDTPIIYSLPGSPGTIIASAGLQRALSAEEFEALMAHEVTHIAFRHVRVEVAMTFIRHANPGLKIVLFPVSLMMIFAKAWTELIEFTADRGALLLTLKPAVVNAAIVKLAAISDPNAGITQKELQTFIESAGDMTSDAAQLERTFKVGQFINAQPQLRERIEQLTEFPQSEQGRECLQRMADLQGVSVASISTYRPTTVGEDLIQEVDEDSGNIGLQ